VVSSPRTETPTKSLASQKTKVVVVVVGGLLVMAALVTMILWTIPGSMRWYLLGLAQTGLAAAGLHLLNSAFLAHDPQAMSYVRGAWGEDNTRTDLARARRKRLCGDGSTASNSRSATSTTSLSHGSVAW
jgi:hypothetical protein